jgi:NAD(P)-dependent dehydrogenase (short-subunit alcohol dehydrogenase family)
VKKAAEEFLRFIPTLLTAETIANANIHTDSKETQLHILVNNAGVSSPPSLSTACLSISTNPPNSQVMATPYSETPQGYEIQWGTNYMGHYLLTRLLLPSMLSTASTAPKGAVRIVDVSSNGHEVFAPKIGIDLDDVNMKEGGTWARYGQSKLGNVLHAKALADRYGDKNILTASLHPGGVST